MKYSTSILAPGYREIEVNLHPGQSFPDHGLPIRLAGGFSSINPETAFPLSSALQLNRDIGGWETEILARFATAELARISSVSYRTYLSEPDFHVCVVARSVQKLNSFLDTYGGILEIEPVLLKNEHPDYDQVTELNVEKNEAGYKVITTFRSPVDFEKCSYCGECGAVCPENCITPVLKVEYGKCSFCKKCETGCPVGAMDIYGAKRKEIEVPALIFLDEAGCHLPQDKSGIYQEEKLDSFFQELFPAQIEETVSCDSSLCLYNPAMKVGCLKCLNACKAGAVSATSEGIKVDSRLCVECGSCHALCPTGAMSSKRLTDSTFLKFLRELVLPLSATVVLGSESDFHRLWWQRPEVERKRFFFLENPEGEILSLFHLLSLYCLGAGKILILDEAGEPSPLKTNLAEETNTIIEALAREKDVVSVCQADSLVEHTGTFVNGLTSNEFIGTDFENRRHALAAALQCMVHNTGADVRVLTDRLRGFGTLSCDAEKCTHCFACLNVCKVKALSAGSEGKTLQHIASYCTGCGVCSSICPEDALAVTTGAVGTDDFFHVKLLAEAEAMLCKGCGKEFGTRKGFEKVMAILASRNMTMKGHFEFCETCRVVKLFEERENV